MVVEMFELGNRVKIIYAAVSVQFRSDTGCVITLTLQYEYNIDVLFNNAM